MKQKFKPTHKIVFTNLQGKSTYYNVMLVEESPGNGPAFTSIEWRLGENSDWELVDGKWLFQGKATPGQVNGTLTIERI